MKAVRRCVRRMSLGHKTKKIPPASSKEEVIEGNVRVLSDLLQKIVASRYYDGAAEAAAALGDGDTDASMAALEKKVLESETHIVDEVTDKLNIMPGKVSHHAQTDGRCNFDESVNIINSQVVAQQLREYVECISNMYPDNDFHSFEHASNVAMNIPKMFSYIVPPVIAGTEDHTYGLKSNPMIEFASVFSALIHDVDHAGVPNAQLVKERTGLAETYHNKSVAEQHSLATAWTLLMQDRFQELRRTIYRNETEFTFFRQLVVNMVMATDISDRDVNAQRKARYEELFLGGNSNSKSGDCTTKNTNEQQQQQDQQSLSSSSSSLQQQQQQDLVNRKATVVLELLMQSADIIHTMQDWDTYKKWNEKLFQECCRAWRYSRADQEPSENWYKGEIGFFDFYIIPLATKLKQVGVFGNELLSETEFLRSAKANRKTWEHRGKKIVSNYVKDLKAQGLWLYDDEKDSDTANGSDTPCAD